MNKMLAFIGGLALVVIVGVVLVLNKPKQTTTPDMNMNQSPTQTTTDPNAAPATVSSVTIQNYAYTPSKITVKKGTKVTWTNQDTVKHDVTSDDNSPQKGLASPLLAKGESFSYTFNTVGTYTYHCTPHPYMKGTVEVTE